MKRGLVIVVVLLVMGGGGYFAYERFFKSAPASLQLVTATVTRGNVVAGIDATGRLQAVTTVQVGSQVSGTIKALYADFNSQVRRGQVVAELEPSLFQTQVEQAEATVVRMTADVERARVQLEDARLKLARARDLAERQLLPKADLETAQANNRTAEAALKSSEAQLVQGRASLNQSKVNLSHTIITAPIDGVVISRNVDVGQTVAASMQAPTLFEIANDLTQMQVNANIDEADIGQIQPGQPVRFQVDAYPGQTFTGMVAQVRLNPVIEQNVVSYVTVISVPNPDLRLRPGMTANVTVEVAREDNTLHVPSSALRFSPTPELFAALGQPVPESLAVNSLSADSVQPRDGAPAAIAPANPPSANREGPPAAGAERAGGEGRGGNDDERQALRARLQQMSPEERQAFFAARGGGGRGGGGLAGGRGAGRGGRPDADAGRGDLQFRGGASPASRRRPGQVWAVIDGRLQPMPVLIGISGGPSVAISGEGVREALVVATGVIETTASAAPAGGGNPLLPQGRGRGAFFGFGGGNRGGGGAGNRGGGGGGRGQ
jgi:HlyD family secretion protein